MKLKLFSFSLLLSFGLVSNIFCAATLSNATLAPGSNATLAPGHKFPRLAWPSQPGGSSVLSRNYMKAYQTQNYSEVERIKEVFSDRLKQFMKNAPDENQKEEAGRVLRCIGQPKPMTATASTPSVGVAKASAPISLTTHSAPAMQTTVSSPPSQDDSVSVYRYGIKRPRRPLNPDTGVPELEEPVNQKVLNLKPTFVGTKGSAMAKPIETTVSGSRAPDPVPSASAIASPIQTRTVTTSMDDSCEARLRSVLQADSLKQAKQTATEYLNSSKKVRPSELAPVGNVWQ